MSQNYAVDGVKQAVNFVTRKQDKSKQEAVMKAYGLKKLHFGPEYLSPKPFDARVLIWEASAVARAAQKEGIPKPDALARLRRGVASKLPDPIGAARVLAAISP